MAADRGELLARLHSGAAALRDALDGVDEELANRKPAESGWSILECVEHVALAEENLLSRLLSATRSEQSHENRTREARIMERAADRTRPVQAPDIARPHGRFENVAEAMKRFDSAWAGTVAFLEGFDGDLRCWVTNHPLIPGPVNCYEILVMIAAHPARHAKQIEETRRQERKRDLAADER
jgi:hypothetical protein